MTNNQPGSFTFREFSKRRNVALILFVRRTRRNHFSCKGAKAQPLEPLERVSDFSV
jgi:hypothetical protein